MTRPKETTAMTPRRSRAGVIASGLSSLVGVLLILLVVPAALVVLGSGYLPDHVPTGGEVADFFTTGDANATKLLGVGVVLAWLAWATLAISILVEIPAAIRGVPAPKIPGLSWQQGRAAAMTGAIAAMLAIGGATTATAATPTTAPTPTAHTATTQVPSTQDVAADETTTAPTTKDASSTVKVEPGDTLWDIAEDTLDDGSRYDEIVDASKKTTQPGGTRLSDPDLIQPGWTLTVPSDHHATETTSTGPSGGASADQKNTGATTAPKDAPAHEQEQDASGVPPAGMSSAGEARPGTIPQSSAAPTTSTAAPTDSSTSPTPTQATDRQDQQEQGPSASAVLSVIGLSTLGCAGLLGLLRWHRARQQQRRRPGRRIALPTGDAAIAESQMRAGSNPLAAADLDNALRSIAANALAGEHSLPALRAARITHDAIEVYLVDDTTSLSTPWTSDGPGTWILEREDLATLPTHHEASPWPALVTLGGDEDDAHLLINLEQIGSLGLVATSTALADEVLNALALELLSSRWGEETQVTLVGVMPELAAALDTPRVTSATDLDTVLSALEHSAEVYRAALSRAGLTSMTQARAAGVIDEGWTPHIVLTDAPLTAAQRERMAHLVDDDLPRVAIAAVTSGDQPLGEWTLSIEKQNGGEVIATLGPAGIVITPQRLPQDAYQAQVDLFTTASVSHTQEEAADLEPADPRLAPTDILSLPRIPSTPKALDPDPQLPEPAGCGSATSWAADTTDRERLEDAEQSRLERAATPAPERSSVEPGEVDDEDADPAAAESAAVESDLVTEQPAVGKDHEDEVGEGSEHGQVRGALEQTASVTLLPTPPGPMVRLLGAPDIIGIGQADTQARVLEVVAYLALFPGQSSAAFNEAIFPGERADERLGRKRNTYLRNARTHLGNGPSGNPYVGLVPDIGYRLSPEIRVDWDQLRELVGEDLTSASTEALRTALELVHGQPLSGLKDSRYAWAMTIKTEMCAVVADVAHELARRASDEGDPRLATWATEKGLAAEPTNETLWRDAIVAAWQSGVDGRAQAVIRRADDVFEGLGVDLTSETQALINTVIQQERAHA